MLHVLPGSHHSILHWVPVTKHIKYLMKKKQIFVKNSTTLYSCAHVTITYITQRFTDPGFLKMFTVIQSGMWWKVPKKLFLFTFVGEKYISFTLVGDCFCLLFFCDFFSHFCRWKVLSYLHSNIDRSLLASSPTMRSFTWSWFCWYYHLWWGWSWCWWGWWWEFWCYQWTNGRNQTKEIW